MTNLQLEKNELIFSNKTNQNNQIRVTGKIISDYSFSHEIYGEKFYTFDLESTRLSENSDILPITVSERLIDFCVHTIGTYVDIIGQIRSYNNYSNEKNKLVLTIFVKNIDLIDGFNTIENEVTLNGFICKPPVFRTTPFGREITDILLAVNRAYNKSDYIPCIIWGRNAKFASKLTISDNIIITGRMQSRPYQKKLEDGQTIERTAYEVSVSKLDYNKIF